MFKPAKDNFGKTIGFEPINLHSLQIAPFVHRLLRYRIFSIFLQSSNKG